MVIDQSWAIFVAGLPARIVCRLNLCSRSYPIPNPIDNRKVQSPSRTAALTVVLDGLSQTVQPTAVPPNSVYRRCSQHSRILSAAAAHGSSADGCARHTPTTARARQRRSAKSTVQTPHSGCERRTVAGQRGRTVGDKTGWQRPRTFTFVGLCGQPRIVIRST